MCGYSDDMKDFQAENKHCMYCGKILVNKRAKTRFCSESCKNGYGRIKRETETSLINKNA